MVLIKRRNIRVNLKEVTLNQKKAIVLSFALAAIVASIAKDLDFFLFGNEVPLTINDKVAHFFGAGFFGFLSVVISEKKITILGVGFNSLLLAFALFSIIEEYSQIFRKNRGFSIADMLANLLGIVTFSKIALWALSKRLFIR
ncbi:MAG: VanZ family protein [Bacteroidia bacterium]